MRSKWMIILILIGGATIGSALFAEAIGLDNDPGWGKGRIALLLSGFLLIGWSAIYSRHANWISSKAAGIQIYFSKIFSRPLILFQSYWHTVVVAILVILVYIWFASSGTWTHWDSPTRYYAELAISFEEGNLYLRTEPNPELLNLPNPHDPSARQGIEYPADYSLYGGRYYLYWGPVPALLLLPIHSFIYKKVGDLFLAFGFICGIFFLQSLLSAIVWNRFFYELPKWMLSLSIFILGLTIPWTSMLINEPSGRIYEAAISGAQFFLMAGFLVAVIAYTRPHPPTSLLILTGALWALAIGTRLILALPVGFMLFMVIYRLWKAISMTSAKFTVKLISLGLPLVLGFICLGWYNWARFGSIMETGFSYGLASTDLQRYHDDLFSSVYIIQNLYNYMLNPPVSTAQFPYLHPQEGVESAILPFFSLPEIYKTNAITGLLFITPFTVFAVLSVVFLIMKFPRNALSKSVTKPSDKDLFNWILASLSGACFFAFCFLLIFFWAAMRYMGDFMPSFILVGVFGFWQGYQILNQRPVYQRIYITTGILLAITGMIMTVVLSLSLQEYGLRGFY